MTAQSADAPTLPPGLDATSLDAANLQWRKQTGSQSLDVAPGALLLKTIGNLHAAVMVPGVVIRNPKNQGLEVPAWSSE